MSNSPLGPQGGDPKLGCPGAHYVRDPKTGELTWHDPVALEIAYWRARALKAEAMIVDYKAWLAQRETNAKIKFWHTPEPKKEKKS